MKPAESKYRVPIILLTAVMTVILCLLGYALAARLRTGASAGSISSAETAKQDNFVLRTAVPETPSPAPTLTPVLAASDEGDELKAPFWSEGSIFTSDEYRSPTLSVRFSACKDSKNFSRRVVYYVADVHVSDVTQIRTASVYEDFAKGGHGKVRRMAEKANALAAISGDYCGCHSNTLIIRNGIVYRDKLSAEDVCLLLRNGEMETIARGKLNLQEILDKDPWQAWQFGPGLLESDGTPRKSLGSYSLNPKNPRSCIGYIEPGHYCFVVADGRQKASRGLTLTELAKLMQSLGCKQAFNLDGGASAHFYWNGKIRNNPSGGGREISDIIYVAKESYPEARFFCGKAGASK
jgi:hypothetical protein